MAPEVTEEQKENLKHKIRAASIIAVIIFALLTVLDIYYGGNIIQSIMVNFIGVLIGFIMLSIAFIIQQLYIN